MGNCLGSSSTTTLSHDHSAPPPSKKQRKEQPYVTDQVKKLRNQANAHHDKVVKCAKESQQAYQRGDKSQAHTLSEEKKKWQKKQNDANRKAATLILQPQRWKTTGEIDLHGLHLDEALEATRDFLNWWAKKSSSKDTVLVITGAGHHSENHKAVIRPKVEQLLKEQKLAYKSVHGNGAYEVTLRKSQ